MDHLKSDIAEATGWLQRAVSMQGKRHLLGMGLPYALGFTIRQIYIQGNKTRRKSWRNPALKSPVTTGQNFGVSHDWLNVASCYVALGVLLCIETLTLLV